MKPARISLLETVLPGSTELQECQGCVAPSSRGVVSCGAGAQLIVPLSQRLLSSDSPCLSILNQPLSWEREVGSKDHPLLCLLCCKGGNKNKEYRGFAEHPLLVR